MSYADSIKLANDLKSKYNAHMGIIVCVHCRNQIQEFEMFNVWEHPNGSIYAHLDECSKFMFTLKKMYETQEVLEK